MRTLAILLVAAAAAVDDGPTYGVTVQLDAV